MTSDEEPDLKLMAKRAETVLVELEAAATAALAGGRYRPGISALAAKVVDLRMAINDLACREIAVQAIVDHAYRHGRQAPRLPMEASQARRHLTLVHVQVPLPATE